LVPETNTFIDKHMSLMRINRYISLTGAISRRRADELIRSARVSINKRRASLGDLVNPASDKVSIDGQAVNVQKPLYLVLNKPKQILTTMYDPKGRPCINDLIPAKYKGVFPVGRLDWDAEGLLILTNDGDLSNALHHPVYGVRKIYLVQVRPPASPGALAKMSNGVILDGKKTRPADIKKVSQNSVSTLLRITLREGRKNQIKRMARSVGLTVTSIKRIAVGPITLKAIKPGTLHELSLEELNKLNNLLKNIRKTLT